MWFLLPRSLLHRVGVFAAGFVLAALGGCSTKEAPIHVESYVHVHPAHGSSLDQLGSESVTAPASAPIETAPPLAAVTATGEQVAGYAEPVSWTVAAGQQTAGRPLLSEQVISSPGAASTAYDSPQPSVVHAELSPALGEAKRALEMQLQVAADNLANADTTAFKASRVLLADAAYRQVVPPGLSDAVNNPTAIGIAVGGGVRVCGTQVDFGQGAIEHTGREIDLAIEGKGFFRAIDPNTGNDVYTRTGCFSINANHQLVVGSALDGRLANPQITFPCDTTSIAIGADGKVSVCQASSPSLAQLGQLQLATFPNPEGLLKLGENLYGQTDASNQATIGIPGQNGMGQVRSGALEASNVNADDEMRTICRVRERLRQIEQLLRE